MRFPPQSPSALIFSVVLVVLVATTRILAADTARVVDDSAAWAAFSAQTPPAATERYGTADPLQELDIYRPAPRPGESNRPSPVIMLVHGGGWSGGVREALAPHARYFAGRGWTSVNISYRLTSQPGVTLMSAQDDIRAAFDWIRAQASARGWDRQRIVVLGESAGGQLACALGILPPEPARWQPHSLVLINPVLDLTSLPWALNQPGLREAGPFDPAKPEKHPASAVSPLLQLRAGSPAILLVHGRDDNVVPFAQAAAFADRAKSVGSKVELVALEKTGHAFLLLEFGSPEAIHATLRRIAEFILAP